MPLLRIRLVGNLIKKSVIHFDFAEKSDTLCLVLRKQLGIAANHLPS